MKNLDIIKDLSELEMTVFDFLISNNNKIETMRIKEIAELLHVSPSLITQVCTKFGYEGFSEFKLSRKFTKNRESKHVTYDVGLLLDYFQKIDNEASQIPIEETARLIKNARMTLLLGLGLSSSIAEFASRLLNRNGFLSQHINDFSTRLETVYRPEDVAIVLSVSGETVEVNKQIMSLKSSGVKIILIANTENTSASKLADITISYYVPNQRDEHFHNSATQIPVLYILESIVAATKKI